MTSLLVAPLESGGAQLPNICSIPPFTSSAGQEAVELAEMVGLVLDPWQQYVLSNALNERADGKWAAFGVGVAVSRQNGKGSILEARELAGLFLLNERLIIHSAHEIATSLEAFHRLLARIEDTPDFSKRVRRVSRAHGDEGIDLHNGQRIRFKTRTTGGTRGFTADCVILDEAYNIKAAAVAAMLPTLSAIPNPQIWYTSSAVDQTKHDNGVVFASVRERGIKGEDPSLAYFEWSAPVGIKDLTEDVVMNPINWSMANPGLGYRITEEAIARERREFAGDIRGFAVERLGIGDWPDTDPGISKVLDAARWDACADIHSSAQNPVYFAFDVAPDRSHSCIVVSGKRDDGLPHIEIVDHRSGTGWIVDRLAKLVAKHRSKMVICDGFGPAGSLIPELEQLKIPILPLGAGDYAKACGIFYDAVMDYDISDPELSPSLRCLPNPALTAAVIGATTKPLGDAWKWDRKNSSVDISPLVASTLALFGTMTIKSSRPRIF